jgi:Sucrase/ferredoxin-like
MRNSRLLRIYPLSADLNSQHRLSSGFPTTATMMSFRHATLSIARFATKPTFQSHIAGTVPWHQCYILLHSSHPPSEFSARKSSSIQRELQLRASKWGGIVNFSWSEYQSVHNALHDGDPEAYSATAFSITNGRLDIPKITLSNLDQIEQELRDHIASKKVISTPKPCEVDLYVCTHRARDCRCGNIGPQVVKALREQAQKHPGRIRVREIGHVGGHKYVSNFTVRSLSNEFKDMPPTFWYSPEAIGVCPFSSDRHRLIIFIQARKYKP